MTLRANQQLGHYTLLEQIAVGGMAEIYLAKTKGVAGFEKHCALKIILPEYANDDGFVQMLIDEANITVSLNHTNIAQIFELGRWDDTYYIAMEYVDGADLFRIMRSLSNQELLVPLDVAAYLAQEICTGLEYAHTRVDQQGTPCEIIHRDISPQNILVSYAGEVKIVDFGIAKAATRSRKTQTGVIKGKYFYMSPEQAWGDPIDARTDVFSAGVVLYEILTGQMLYSEEDMHKLLHLARQADIRPPTELRSDIPPQLEEIVMRALVRDPDHRWQSAGEFRAALTSFLFAAAPDFTPDRLARLVRIALDDEDPGSFPRRPPSSPASKAVWRGIPSPAPPPDTNQEFEDLTPIQSLRMGGARRLDDLERTMVSGPPQMAPPNEAAQASHEARQPAFDDNAWDGQRDPAAALSRHSSHQPPEVIVASPSLQDSEASVPAEVTGSASSQLRGGFDTEELSDSAVALMEPTVVGFTPQQPDEEFEAGNGDSPRSLAAPTSAERALAAKLPDASDTGEDTPIRPRSRLQEPTPAFDDTAPLPQIEADPASDLSESAQRPFLDTDRELAAARASAGIDDSARSATSQHAGDGTSAIESPTAAVPASRAPGRRPAWRVAVLAFVLTTALAAAGITVAVFVVPKVEPSATLEVISVPEGAEVELNGEKLEGRTRLEIPIADPTREHKLAVSLPDYERWTSAVRFEPDEERKQVIASLTPKFGRLLVESTPTGAEVLLNGRSIGKTPVQADRLSLKHKPRIELRLAGYETVKRQIAWKEQTWQRLKVVLRRSSAP
jgi:serine/threonine protein kinase